MKRFQILVPFAIGLALVACSQQNPAIFPSPSSTVITTPKASGAPSQIEQVNRGVAAAEQTLTLLYQTALVYTSLPRCGTGPKICSDREIVRQIRERAIQAHNAIVAARSNEALVGPAWTAINAFRAIVPG